ncbi:hypothetical protein CITRIK5_110015 [Citricoccus sp. K5]|nr:hypothetical protein CITRIK5_110015 [Citricoccus sp. K5]
MYRPHRFGLNEAHMAVICCDVTETISRVRGARV